MGKMAIILVIGLSMSVGIVAVQLNKSKTGITENVVGFDKYTNARNIAHTGVNMVLRRMDKNDTSIANPLARSQTAWFVTNVMSGLCSVSVRLTTPPKLDTIDITSNSHFLDSSYNMQVRLYRFPVPFPEVNAAVNLLSSPIKFTMSGNPSIDGSNWDMDGRLNPDRSTDTNGVAVVSQAESSRVAVYNSDITGSPNKVTAAALTDPGPFVTQYIAAADFTFPDGSVNTGNYGSPATPVIAYANGSVTFGGTGSFYGVLVINGSIDLQGTFDMYGLVIAYGDSTSIAFSTSAGTPRIYGSIIETGPANSQFTMKGTADVRYSAEALLMAKYIGKLQVYRVLRWYE